MAEVASSPKNGIGGSSWIAGFQGDEAPYSYKTETGEQYDVTIVTYKFGKKVETGTITFGNGDKYEGDWSMGSKNGKGIYRCFNGVVYEGRWKDDMRHGYGTCTYANGDVYKGKWAKNQKHGDGCYTFANGNQYTGDWRSDRACGKGVCDYANKDRSKKSAILLDLLRLFGRRFYRMRVNNLNLNLNLNLIGTRATGRTIGHTATASMYTQAVSTMTVHG